MVLRRHLSRAKGGVRECLPVETEISGNEHLVTGKKKVPVCAHVAEDREKCVRKDWAESRSCQQHGDRLCSVRPWGASCPRSRELIFYEKPVRLMQSRTRKELHFEKTPLV